VTTNTGFKNEQFELNATDANIPQLALQGVTELQEFIEARKASTESVRHLADVLSKKLRLQPAAGSAENGAASGGAAAFAHGAPDSAPSSETSSRAHRQSMRDGLLNRLLPIGYQDESGYHQGVKNERRANGNGQAPASGAPAT